MFGLSVQIKDEIDRVRQRAKDAGRKSFARTAFLIRKSAIESIVSAQGPSAPGSPPHTHSRTRVTKKGKTIERGNRLRKAILYKADKQGAVIGPSSRIFGKAGKAHEFGGEFRGESFDKRPFMSPALKKNLDVFARSWSNSVSS